MVADRFQKAIPALLVRLLEIETRDPCPDLLYHFPQVHGGAGNGWIDRPDSGRIAPLFRIRSRQKKRMPVFDEFVQFFPYIGFILAKGGFRKGLHEFPAGPG